MMICPINAAESSVKHTAVLAQSKNIVRGSVVMQELPEIKAFVVHIYSEGKHEQTIDSIFSDKSAEGFSESWNRMRAGESVAVTEVVMILANPPSHIDG